MGELLRRALHLALGCVDRQAPNVGILDKAGKDEEARFCDGRANVQSRSCGQAMSGPVIRQFLGEMETCHKLTLSPALALKKTWSPLHSAGAGTRLGRFRLMFCAAKTSNAPVLTAFPPATGHTHQSEVGNHTARLDESLP